MQEGESKSKDIPQAKRYKAQEGKKAKTDKRKNETNISNGSMIGTKSLMIDNLIFLSVKSMSCISQ